MRLIGLLIYKFIRIGLYLVNRFFIILVEVLLPEIEISSSWHKRSRLVVINRKVPDFRQLQLITATRMYKPKSCELANPWTNAWTSARQMVQRIHSCKLKTCTSNIQDWEHENPSFHFGINPNKFQILQKYLALQKTFVSCYSVNCLLQIFRSKLYRITTLNIIFYSTFTIRCRKCVT